jgi:glucosylceramidase
LFQARQIKTLIWVFDHNFNNPGFPATILRDPQAAQYVDGSAFHLYEGKPEAMSKLHREFPDKPIYFTEGSVYGAKGAAEIIDYFRNWAGSYNAWVTMIDHQGKPNVSGFHDCDPTIIVLNRDTLQTEYRADYYIYGQFMKFIAPGAVRIASSLPSKSPANVAFQNPDGSLVLVVAHPGSSARDVVVEWEGRNFTATLSGEVRRHLSLGALNEYDGCPARLPVPPHGCLARSALTDHPHVPVNTNSQQHHEDTRITRPPAFPPFGRSHRRRHSPRGLHPR